jgi:hypothetical protein
MSTKMKEVSPKALGLSANTKNKKFEEIAGFHLKVQKLYDTVQEVVKKLEDDKAFFNYIIALSAVGIAVANVDGEISKEEELEINEFIGGIASSYYPDFVKKSIQNIKDNPPTFNEALVHLEKVDISSFESIRNLIEVIILADEQIYEDEKVFLKSFDFFVNEKIGTESIKQIEK